LEQQTAKCTPCSNNLSTCPVYFIIYINRIVCSFSYLCKWDCLFLVLCFLSHNQKTIVPLIAMRGRVCRLAKQVFLTWLLYFLNYPLLLVMVSKGQCLSNPLSKYQVRKTRNSRPMSFQSFK
jgi:hypothetical protein